MNRLGNVFGILQEALDTFQGHEVHPSIRQVVSFRQELPHHLTWHGLPNGRS